MVDNRQKTLTRRGIIKSTAPALVATSLFATNASASEDHTSDTNIILEDGELTYKGPKKTVTQAEAKRSSADFSPSDLEGYMQKGIEGLNDAQSDGYIEFTERDGELWALPTDKGREFANDHSRVGLLCGTNDYTSGTTLRGPYHAIKMDDGLSTDVASLMLAGAAAGAIATQISASVGGIPVSVLGAIAAALSTLGAGLITNANDGCGVVIRHYPHLGVVPGIGLVFRSQ